MKCSKCNAEIADNVKFCPICGAKVESESKCPNCGAAISKDAKFCAKCGCRIEIKLKCPECGTEIKDGNKYCSKCGTKADTCCVDNEQATKLEIQTTDNIEHQQVAQKSQQTTRNKSSRKTKIITILVAAFVLLSIVTVIALVTVFGTDHEYVDLGLPSGTLWATCNVGANIPEENGDYFAWGETTTKKVYNLDTYLYYDGNYMTKYIGLDNLTTLQPSDDAATANWGENWCMPTKEQWEELVNECTWTWTSGGYKVTGKNGKSIFLPAAGWNNNREAEGVGSCLGYHSSSLYIGGDDNVWHLDCAHSNFDFCDVLYGNIRPYGYSVRPVISK